MSGVQNVHVGGSGGIDRTPTNSNNNGQNQLLVAHATARSERPFSDSAANVQNQLATNTSGELGHLRSAMPSILIWQNGRPVQNRDGSCVKITIPHDAPRVGTVTGTVNLENIDFREMRALINDSRYTLGDNTISVPCSLICSESSLNLLENNKEPSRTYSDAITDCDALPYLAQLRGVVDDHTAHSADEATKLIQTIQRDTSPNDAAKLVHTAVSTVLGRSVNNENSIHRSRTISVKEKDAISHESDLCQQMLYLLMSDEGRAHCFSSPPNRLEPYQEVLQDAAIGMVTGIGICNIYGALSAVFLKCTPLDADVRVVKSDDHRWAEFELQSGAPIIVIDAWKNLRHSNAVGGKYEHHCDQWPSKEEIINELTANIRELCRNWMSAPGINDEHQANVKSLVSRRLAAGGWGSLENREKEANALEEYQRQRARKP